jgi:SulP family sulfate permease
MHQLAQDADITMVLTGLHGRLHGQFLHGGLGQVADTRLFPDLDRGVEWCESQIVSGHLATKEHDQNLTELLVTLVPASPAIQRLTDYLRREEVAAGECLIKQGDMADRVFFIESGQVSTYLESPDGEPVRLETMRGGRVVGELAFYLRIPRSATVVVDESATVYSLSLEQLARMESIDPAAAEVFHHVMAQLLADRVIHLMTTVEALRK